MLGFRAIGFDLKNGSDLEMWEFRSNVLNSWGRQTPTNLVLAPPCTDFSQMTTLWNKKKFSQEEWDERFEKSCVLFGFAVMLAGLQHRAGRRFKLEQPAGAGSLQRDNVLELLRDPTIYTTKFDQCRFGLVSPLGNPMKKATICCHELAQLAPPVP